MEYQLELFLGPGTASPDQGSFYLPEKEKNWALHSTKTAMYKTQLKLCETWIDTPSLSAQKEVPSFDNVKTLLRLPKVKKVSLWKILQMERHVYVCCRFPLKKIPLQI